MAEKAGRDGRRVVASPVAGNPYHGEIVLPDSAVTDLAIQLYHAQRLAEVSRWCEPSGGADR